MKLFKKIACIGTHSVGKSTLCYQLAEKAKRAGENVHVIQERVRFSPFPINEKMVYETAIWACTNQISKELEAHQKGFSLIICDRSALDPFFYADYFELIPNKTIQRMATQWLQTYDELYFVRPRQDHLPTADGVRSTDLEFVKSIDRLFAQFIFSSGTKVKTIYTDEIFR